MLTICWGCCPWFCFGEVYLISIYMIARVDGRGFYSRSCCRRAKEARKVLNVRGQHHRGVHQPGECGVFVDYLIQFQIEAISRLSIWHLFDKLWIFSYNCAQCFYIGIIVDANIVCFWVLRDLHEVANVTITWRFLLQEENRRIEMKWRSKIWPSAHHSTVVIQLEQRDDGTLLTLHQAGIPGGSDAPLMLSCGDWINKFCSCSFS